MKEFKSGDKVEWNKATVEVLGYIPLYDVYMVEDEFGTTYNVGPKALKAI